MSWIGPGLQWSAALQSKLFWIQDHCESALATLKRDPLIQRALVHGLRRKVTFFSFPQNLASLMCILKICHVVLYHLTGAVVQIDTYLRLNPPPRGNVEKLNWFRRIVPDMQDKKKTDTVEPASPQAAQEKAAVLHLLSLISLPLSTFLDNYSIVQVAMAQPMTAEERLSKVMHLRLLSMSAITWNRESKSKPRDWGFVCVAFTLESALIVPYRRELLLRCPGALRIRRDLLDVLSPLTITRMTSTEGGGVSMGHVWHFPDAIYLDPPSDSACDDLASLTSAWNSAWNQGLDPTAKDPAFDIIRSLEGNKYLRSVSGTHVESLAHHCITALARVRPHSLPFPLYLTLSRLLL
jgi:hypothetical protein